MCKKIKTQEKRYRATILIVVIVGMFIVKNELTKFLNRDDLTEYVKSHQSEVSVIVYSLTAILGISAILAALYIKQALTMCKNNDKEDFKYNTSS
jgi:uncharacterized membrane protein